MPKKIPSSYEQDDSKSIIRRAQRKQKMKEKGSGGIHYEAKEYIKMLKKGSKKGK